ncbi:GntR family transcriptional regulator [Streptomyces sp. NPDC046900]|uniref:GntR family transcriptional regulator n=1 Tax=Streptomyces sp. NPDC046900 TaxID=3155473 RepID=UPI0033CC54C1
MTHTQADGPPICQATSRSRSQRARQAADVLRQRITSGALGDGLLPDEGALGAQLGASRNAVREALDLLRSEGLIMRRRGVGTMIVMPKYGHGLDRLAGLAEMLTGYGTVTNDVRVAEVVTHPPPAIAERLQLANDAGAVRIERLRRANGSPLSLDTSYLPLDIGRHVLRGDLAGTDVFALIEQATGCLLGSAEVTVHAVAADVDTAALLEIEVGAPVFAIERLTRLSDRRPVDAESIHIRADQLALQATVYRQPPAASRQPPAASRQPPAASRQPPTNRPAVESDELTNCHLMYRIWSGADDLAPARPDGT